LPFTSHIHGFDKTSILLNCYIPSVIGLKSLIFGTKNWLHESKSRIYAGDKYRMAITVFTEQAKTELAEYLDRKTIEVSSKTVDEQRAVIQKAARVAFRSEASDKAANLGLVLGEAAREFRRSMWSRLMQHAITALIASGFTVGILYAFVKIH
jgi:hypothetical protein